MADAPGAAGTLVVVEDDAHIADLVDMYARQRGFKVFQAGDGETGLAIIRREQPRLAVVDVGLPGAVDGFEVCRRLRADRHSNIAHLPMIMLTARDAEVDRVVGLELGADDYVTKPFSPRELMARIAALLRRSDGPAPEMPRTLLAGAIEVDTARREASVDGQAVALAQREFDLLAHLAANPGLVLSRRQLLDSVWGEGWYGDERTVDVHVRQLRRKLGQALPLATVWGVGYRLS